MRPSARLAASGIGIARAVSVVGLALMWGVVWANLPWKEAWPSFDLKPVRLSFDSLELTWIVQSIEPHRFDGDEALDCGILP